MSDKITFVCVTQNRIEYMKRNIPKVIDYVDRIVIVDGFSVDGTKEWLESYSPKIFVTQRRWDDSFANQYNEYLKHIGEGWVLLCDDDELPSEALLKSLKDIIKNSNEGKVYSSVEFKCHGMEIDKDGKVLLDPGPCEYYRLIFYLYQTNMKYLIDLHQSLVGYKNGRSIRRQETYYHLKTNEDMYRNACRNWWIAGVWLPNATEGVKVAEWHELRDLVLKVYPDVKVFGDFNAVMVKGNMDKSVKDYLLKIKDIPDDEKSGRLLNELRSYYKYYFDILHPEERP
jgi:glycosyltransferase involved in cell wall biosynthesis